MSEKRVNLKKLIFLLLLPVLAAPLVFSYTLEDLEASLKANNPDLLKLSEEYSRSLLDVKDAKAGLGPSIDLQVSGTYMVNPPVDAIYLNVDEIFGTKTGQVVKVYDGMENTLYNFQLSLTQPVFTWGKLTNAVKIYEQVSKIKQTQLLSQEEQLGTELKTRVTTLFYLKQILGILDEEKVFAQRLVQVSEEAEKSGMLLHQDVVDAKIKAKELEIAQQDLNEQLKNQLIELEHMTALENLTIDQLECSADEELFDSIIKSDLSVLEQKALEGSQYSIQLLTQLKEVSQTAEKVARGYEYWKPDFALQAQAGYSGSRFPFFEPNWRRKDMYSVNLSVGFKTTVWDGGKKLNDIARKASETKTADINQADARSTIKKTLNTQWNTAQVCTMKIEYQDLKIEAAQSKIKQQETIFQSGYGSETDVLSAKIECCNEQIEKVKQQLTRAVSCLTINYLSN